MPFRVRGKACPAGLGRGKHARRVRKGETSWGLVGSG